MLHEATAWCGGPSAREIVRLLLNAGPDPNAATADGATPVHFAAGRAEDAGGRTNNVRVFPRRLVFGVTALVLLAGCAGLMTLAVRIVRRW